MGLENDAFIREFHIETIEKTLKLSQRIEGDVNCVVWDASMVLAKYLEEIYRKNQNFFKDLNVLELGAGVGCVGLAAASLGAKNVVLTDLKENLSLLKTNIELNKEATLNNVHFCELRWGEAFENEIKPNIILMADCIYYKESIEPLVNTLKNIAEKYTVIYLSQELRDSDTQKECWKLFMKTISDDFSSQFVPLKEHHSDFRSPDILILKLQKKN